MCTKLSTRLMLSTDDTINIMSHLKSNKHINALPIRILQLIQNFGWTEDQVNLIHCSKWCSSLNVTTIDKYYCRLEDYLHILLNNYNMKNCYVMQMTKLKVLCINFHIDRCDVQELTELIWLYAYRSAKIITDSNISGLTKLRYLDASRNKSITDSSIEKLMELEILYTDANPN